MLGRYRVDRNAVGIQFKRFAETTPRLQYQGSCCGSIAADSNFFQDLLSAPCGCEIELLGYVEIRRWVSAESPGSLDSANAGTQEVFCVSRHEVRNGDVGNG